MTELFVFPYMGRERTSHVCCSGIILEAKYEASQENLLRYFHILSFYLNWKLNNRIKGCEQYNVHFI